MDLLDVICKRLNEAGIKDVYTTPDARKHPEFVALSFGVPDRKVMDFSGAVSSPLRVTIIVVRLSEYQAMVDAQKAEEVMRTASLHSENGSYELEDVDTLDARPLPSDESGRYVWCVDVYIDTRKDWF